jgi:spore maturation protein SpmA
MTKPEKFPQKGSAINGIFIFLILAGILSALVMGTTAEVTKASFEAAATAVKLAIGLVGAMALWLGLMKVVERAGLLLIIARRLKPLMTRLFPDVPGEHPAMSAMIMNMAANIMGLGNAATPFGIKAMEELDRLNPHKGTATNAMCLFLAINTSSVTLLPMGVIAVRAGAGALDPAGILLPSILSTTCSTLVAILAAKSLAGHSGVSRPTAEDPRAVMEDPSAEAGPTLDTPARLPAAEGLRRLCLPAYFMVFLAALAVYFYRRLAAQANLVDFFLQDLPSWLIPFLMGLFIVYGFSRKVPVYESVCEGAKEGFDVALRIIPFLVAILVAIAIFRASGALELCIHAIEPLTTLIGMPADTLPMALVRPLSGSGAFGVMSDLVSADPNSRSAFIAGIMQGSTETTFYVLAVYFGAVRVTRVRHAVTAALLADLAGILAAVFWGNMFYTG